MSCRLVVDSAWAWLTVGLGFTLYSMLVRYCWGQGKAVDNNKNSRWCDSRANQLKTLSVCQLCALSAVMCYLLKCGLDQVGWEHVAAKQDADFTPAIRIT